MRYHLIAIGGTGMGALAGLLKAAGHEVRGSDHAVYPPMSEQLAAMNIPVFEGFGAENLEWGPEVVVVGNVCSREHPEVVAAQELDLPMTSLPKVLGDEFLQDRDSIVVAGTHGKTTTSSILTHVLMEAGRDPSCFIGGVPLSLGRGWRLGGGSDFVVEGDEYDSAFFDKGSKFLHYRPKRAILTSVELDHVDIFSSMSEIRATFRTFLALIPPDGRLVVAASSDEAVAVAKESAQCLVESYAVEGQGRESDADWLVRDVEVLASQRTRFELCYHGESLGRFETLLGGAHNLANIAATVATARSVGVTLEEIRDAIASFPGVKRRQEIRGIASGVTVIDDYGHHPTAIAETLQGLRKRYPGRRLVALYEPRSATSRRRTFQAEFAQAFSHADTALIGSLHAPEKIPVEERFDPEKMAIELRRSGTTARYIPKVAEMVRVVVADVRPGDVVVVFSSGAFGGIHDGLLAALGDAVMPARPRDLDEIRSLLASEDLDFAALEEEHLVGFMVLRNETGFAGCVCLEVIGHEAILSSLAVEKEFRGAGYGWMLAEAATSLARTRGVRRVYLLTETAGDFFAEKLGFRVVDLGSVEPKVAESSTFRAQENRSMVAMRLDL